MSEHTQEHDTPWKEIIETLFPQFMGFFFPEAHVAIDWSRAPVFLDKELQQIVRGAATGRRFVDKLVKVWQSGGQETWVLVHIEVQGQRSAHSPNECSSTITACLTGTRGPLPVSSYLPMTARIGGPVSIGMNFGAPELRSNSRVLS